MSKGDQAAAMTGGEDSLLPIVVFGNVTPDEIMSQFPAAEGDCLKEHLSADRMAEILQTASPTILEGIVIAGCLETITFVRLFMGGFLPESGTYSDSTNACLAGTDVGHRVGSFSRPLHDDLNGEHRRSVIGV